MLEQVVEGEREASIRSCRVKVRNVNFKGTEKLFDWASLVAQVVKNLPASAGDARDVD